MRAALAALVLLAGPAGPAFADPIDDALAEATRICVEDGGAFSADDAVRALDLDGDGDLDRLLDESAFECTSFPSMYCGSGGCLVRAEIDGAATAWLAKAWMLVEWGDWRVLLLERDAAECAADAVGRCVEAVTWSPEDGRFQSVDPRY